MFKRISAVTALALTSAYLASSPDWKSVLAFFAALSAYVGIEISQHTEKKKADGDVQKVLSDLRSHGIAADYVSDPNWPGTALSKLDRKKRVCERCLKKDGVDLVLIWDPDNKRWGCAGCHTQLNPL